MIEDGVKADFFQEKGKVVSVRITLADDKKTIQQILVKSTDEPLERADSHFTAILKGFGPQTNGVGGLSYVRLDVDAKGRVLKSFPLRITSTTSDMKVAMGKFNPQTKKWEAGEPIPNGLYGDIFRDLGAKTVYVQITMRDEKRGVAEILVQQVGGKR